MEARETVSCLFVTVAHLEAEKIAGVEDLDGLFLPLTRVDCQYLEGLGKVVFAEPGSFTTEEEGADDVLYLSYLHVDIVEDGEWDPIIEAAAFGGGQVVDQTKFPSMRPGLAKQTNQLEVGRVVR